MKDKIERFSKGKFEYELPFLILSESEIHSTVEAGKSLEGSIVITNSEKRLMKGILYSSNNHFVLKTTNFGGVENTIHYQCKAEFLNPGNEIRGFINIISDCGEKKIPYLIKTEAKFIDSPIGKLKDLFQFANLAKTDWAEAKQVFRMDSFESVLLAGEEKYRLLYKSLIKSSSLSHAMEEFLIAVHKKSRIHIEVNKSRFEFTNIKDSFMEKLILTKNQWGYEEIRVSADAPFLKPEQKLFWADSFLGNTFELSVLIDATKLQRGNNYGRILISTIYESITVEVLCNLSKDSMIEAENHKLLEQLKVGFVKNYLSFRMDRISLSKYLNESEAFLNNLTLLEETILYKMIRIHNMILAGKNNKAKLLLDELTKDDTLVRKSALEYCFCLYLSALLTRDESIISSAIDRIHHYYENGNTEFGILWILFYMDKHYDTNKTLKLSMLKEQFQAGCHSPVLYYEAICLFNDEPVLLRELSEFEIQVMYFGAKYKLFTKETELQYIYLANRQKRYHNLIFGTLVKLYDDSNSKETLTAICSLLIKGLKKGNQYFHWFRLGVEEELRITELYEYYMYSAEEDMEVLLPQPILLYFIYSSSLNDRKKAYLFANIIKNKQKNEAIYRTYYKKMEVFAAKQLEAHHSDRQLAVLYEEFAGKDKINPEYAGHLPYIIFDHEIYCENKNIIGVIVVHKELEREEYQPFVNGRSIIRLYTKNAEILLVDQNNNRYSSSIAYSLNPLYKPESFAAKCLNYNSNPMLLLHIFDKNKEYQIVNENAVALMQQVLHIDGLMDEYKIHCLQALIYYYYDNYNSELLDLYLLQMDIQKVRHKDRMKLLELFINRDLLEKAIEALNKFGYDGVSVNKLVRLCSKLIEEYFEKEDTMLLSLCHYVFHKGKYDDSILNYLVRNFNGSTEDMVDLWRAAENFEVPTHELAERLLAQILFTESYVQENLQIFLEYYKNVSNHNLVNAYLSYYAYRYLVHDRVIKPEIFQIMKRELNYEENDICMLALLKNMTTWKTLADSELHLAEYQINNFIKKGIRLPFFKEFVKFFKLPQTLMDKFMIEYRTDSRKKVYIHYCVVKKGFEENYVTELMSDMMLGIHVKEFLLFHQEILQYYITEEFGEEVNITESIDIHYDNEMSDGDTKFNQINLMLMAKEMQDDSTLLELMEHYGKQEYIMSKCFHPLG